MDFNGLNAAAKVFGIPDSRDEDDRRRKEKKQMDEIENLERLNSPYVVKFRGSLVRPRLEVGAKMVT